MKYIKGDIIELFKSNEYDVLAHGCNCFKTMGGGLAYQIKKHFPGAYGADLKTLNSDRNKMGTFSVYHFILDGKEKYILNCYIQYYYGRTITPDGKSRIFADYVAIRSCMKNIKEKYSGKKILLPYIGCGLAGGDWKIVENIIYEELYDEDVTIAFL